MRENYMKHLMKHPALNRGRFMRAKTKDIERLAWFPENRELVKSAFPLYRFEDIGGEDGWIIPGRSGEVCEYGVGKLCVTVVGTFMIRKAEKAFAHVMKCTQRGDGEANFCMVWTAENLAGIAKILKLRRRRL